MAMATTECKEAVGYALSRVGLADLSLNIFSLKIYSVIYDMGYFGPATDPLWELPTKSSKK